MNQKIPRPAIVVIALAVIAALYFGLANLRGDGNGDLTASGSIEGTVVNIAPEMSGKVLAVDVEEGQLLNTDDPILRLDPSLLTAQQAVASASLDSAKAGSQTAQTALTTASAQYEIVLQAALAQDKKTRSQDWFARDTEQFNQPEWYFTRAEQVQSAQDQVTIAKNAWEDAKANLANVSGSLEKSKFLEAEKRLLNARLAYEMARDVNNRAQNSATSNAPVGKYNSTHCGTNQGYKIPNQQLVNMVYRCTGDEHLTDVSQKLYDDAKQELTDAQTAYDDMLSTQSADDVLLARAEVSVAQERYYSALDSLRALQTGDQSNSVVAAQGALSQAEAAAEQSQKAISQAQANLDLINAQIKKLTVFAPMDGVVLTRNVEPGEFVQPGAVALTMADITDLTITVYVPEDRYGEVSLGKTATVSVDSFPDLTFAATVVHIADQAEFTPRNVQTVEGRSSTFYAIKLKVQDPDGKLKIGMPADVVFK